MTLTYLSRSLLPTCQGQSWNVHKIYELNANDHRHKIASAITVVIKNKIAIEYHNFGENIQLMFIYCFLSVRGLASLISGGHRER